MVRDFRLMSFNNKFRDVMDLVKEFSKALSNQHVDKSINFDKDWTHFFLILLIYIIKIPYCTVNVYTRTLFETINNEA